VSKGSKSVTFGNGASLPAPSSVGAVGQGDVLILDPGGDNEEILYILSRDSATQATLINPPALDHNGVGYTITRAYSGPNAIQEWESDRDGNLVSEKRVEVGVAYKDGVFNAGVEFDGSTTDANHYMRLTVAPGQRHTGKAGTGVKIDPASAGDVIVVEDDYVVVEWFEIADFGATSQVYSGIHLTYSGNVTVRNNLIHDNVYWGISWGIKDRESDGGNEIFNNIIYGGPQPESIQVGISSYWSDGPSKIYNNTIYNTGTGILVEQTDNVDVRNNLVIGCEQGFEVSFGGSWGPASDYNASSDASSPGINSLDAITAADTFVSIAEGSEDLHLKPGADVVDQGMGLSGTLQDDIDGESRPRGPAWDIGADES
jgi:parallel beta-helix repeat protein